MSVGINILCSLGNLMFQNVNLCRLLHTKKSTDWSTIVSFSFILSFCWFNISKKLQNFSLECGQIINMASKYLRYKRGDLPHLFNATSTLSATEIDEQLHK